jgi:hypothetical protein
VIVQEWYGAQFGRTFTLGSDFVLPTSRPDNGSLCDVQVIAPLLQQRFAPCTPPTGDGYLCVLAGAGTGLCPYFYAFGLCPDGALNAVILPLEPWVRLAAETYPALAPAWSDAGKGQQLVAHELSHLLRNSGEHPQVGQGCIEGEARLPEAHICYPTQYAAAGWLTQTGTPENNEGWILVGAGLLLSGLALTTHRRAERYGGR